MVYNSTNIWINVAFVLINPVHVWYRTWTNDLTTFTHLERVSVLWTLPVHSLVTSDFIPVISRLTDHTLNVYCLSAFCYLFTVPGQSLGVANVSRVPPVHPSYNIHTSCAKG